MFGYVRADKPEMKIKEYEAYKGLYCSLCKAMGKHFGLLSRLTLSYDITFLLLARLSFLGRVPEFNRGRCPFNPSKSCNYCQNSNEELRYAAAVSMMMFYFKVRDNISDSSFFKRLVMYLILPWASLKYKKAKRLYGEVAQIIEQAMSSQAKIEASATASSDEAAHSSAEALGKITAYNIERGQGDIYRFGYAVGKWVYLTDAFDDIEGDLKSKSFNVFIKKYNITDYSEITPEIKEEIRGTLNMCCGYFIEAYEKIQQKSLTPIMENIIYGGTEKTIETVLNKNLKGKK